MSLKAGDTFTLPPGIRHTAEHLTEEVRILDYLALIGEDIFIKKSLSLAEEIIGAELKI